MAADHNRRKGYFISLLIIQEKILLLISQNFGCSPKANVSQAVESLIQKGLLKRTADQTDRRKIHLSLLPQTADITAAICSMQANLYSQIFCGLSEGRLEIL